MTKKKHWLIVIVSGVCLLVVPTASSETMSQDTFKGEPPLNQRYEGAEEHWVNSDIEEILNIYGPTSAGNSPNTKTNNLPYEEMGVEGVEYENLFIERYLKDTDAPSSNTVNKTNRMDLNSVNK